MTEQADFFGAPQLLKPGKGRRKTPKVKGYAFTPGTGPAGKTCNDCMHHYKRRYAKTYHKCDLVKATGGPGTDIRVRSPACKFFEQTTRLKAVEV